MGPYLLSYEVYTLWKSPGVITFVISASDVELIFKEINMVRFVEKPFGYTLE
jgi:hypothetical protein